MVHMHCVREPGATPIDEFEWGATVESFTSHPRSPAPLPMRLSAPPPVRWFHSGSLRRHLRDSVRWQDFDLVHLDEMLLLPYLPAKVPVPLVVHHHKLDLDHARALGHKRSTCSRWDRLEDKACTRTLHHVVCGLEDAQRLHTRHPHVRAHVIACGADTRHFEGAQRRPVQGRVLFLGSLDYEPNVRALESFVPQLLTARSHNPDLHLQIVGARPGPRVDALIREGVTLQADVPEVLPFLERSEALVAPLGIGGGSRVKICEALAAGCPVLASPTAAEGLELTDGDHLTLVPEPHDWEKALLTLLDGPAAASEQAQRGRERIRERHSWPRLAGRLHDAWAGCLRVPARRVVRA